MSRDYFNFVGSIYDFWHSRRKLLFALVALVLMAIGLYSVNVPISHDIESMLPDKNRDFRNDFELFSHAPFARNILISLEVANQPDQKPAMDDISFESLTRAADKVTDSLGPPFFIQAVSGIDQTQKLKIFEWIYAHLPNLINDEDIDFLENKLSATSIDHQLQDNIKVLHSPESLVLKQLVLKDPLAFREILPGKMQQLNLVPNFSADDEYFLSKDKKHLLIIAETPIAITDYGSSKEMLEYLYQVLNELKPQGINSRVICGHLYTVANAETIQADLWRVFSISLIGLLLIFLFFLRDRQALVVLLIPVTALLAGIAATRFCFGTVSSITIGFGAVLLGISADFGLHVLYALQQEHIGPRRILTDLVKPLSYCALTTIGVFAVLLFSALPGQRQMAVFSIAGISTAMLFALFVMPHLMTSGTVLHMKKLSMPKMPAFVAPLWLLVLIVAVIPAANIKFDGNLRSIGVVPKNALEDEVQIRDTWGVARDQAFVFSIAKSLEEALQKNELLFQKLKNKIPQVDFLNLASLMPSQQTQEKNLKRWSDFWNSSDRKAALRTSLEQKGLQYGFTSSAFDLFLRWLDQPQKPFTLNEFKQDCNDKILSPFVAELKNERVAVLTFVPDNDEVIAFIENMPQDFRIVSNRRFSAQLNREIVGDFTQFFSWSISVVIVFLFILFRNIKKVAFAILPVVAGIVIMSAVMSISGIKFNLFNIVAAILVIGLAVDYGIFVVCTCQKKPNNAVCNAVLVSGLTTFVGFGSLMVARHPAMNSIGTTVVAGIIPALLCALTLVPYLAGSFLGQKNEKD